MIRKLFRWVVRSAVVAGAVALVMRLLRRGQEESDTADVADAPSPSPAPEPTPAGPTKVTPSVSASGSAVATRAEPEETTAPGAGPSAGDAWVTPDQEGACPASHPVKVKESSGIFHVPGGLAYDRTAPDRCYRDAAAAEADGFRPAKR